MAVGGRYIANALSAGKKAATRQLNPDGSKSLLFESTPHMCANQWHNDSYYGFFLSPSAEMPPQVDHTLRYYDGGFEETMDRREASLILGCRESACQEQIMDRYRNLIRVNHPDMGGSPYLAGKINDAKNILYSRARSDPEWVKSRKRRAEREAKRKEMEENPPGKVDIEKKWRGCL